MMKIYLSKILGERRITQAELSRLTGIRPATINEWYINLPWNLQFEIYKTAQTEAFIK